MEAGTSAEKRNEPKSVDEQIVDLPASWQEFAKTASQRRTVAALIFIALVLFGGGPLWWTSTQVYRATTLTFPNATRIFLPIRVVVEANDAITTNLLNSIQDELERRLQTLEVERPISLQIELVRRDLSQLDLTPRFDRRVESDTPVEFRLALVPSESWPYGSATSVFLASDDSAQVRADVEGEKLLSRLETTIADILIDAAHLSAIVRRDLRQRMAAWQVAALPPSQQKRLVWDSAALAQKYLVQIVHIHPTRSDEAKSQQIFKSRLNSLARVLENVTQLEFSHERLWDFSTDAFVERDVQQRVVLPFNQVNGLLSEVERQLGAVDSSSSLLRIVVLHRRSADNEPILILDAQSEDAPDGLSVAAWGALISDAAKADDDDGAEVLEAERQAALVVTHLRVMLGLDSEFPVGWKRSRAPVAQWELERMRLRAYVDHSMRTLTSVAAFHRLLAHIDNIAVEDEVAESVNTAVQLALDGWKTAQHSRKLAVRELGAAAHHANSAISAPSLLALLYFPTDQKLAVYAPFFVPVLVPIVGSTVGLLGKVIKRRGR